MTTGTEARIDDDPLATRWVVPILVGEVVLSVVLGSIRLGHKSLWYDEAFSAMSASRGVSGVVDVARHLDANMPLFALVLVPWRVLGEGEAAMRSLSVVCMALAVVAVHLLGAELFDRATGLLAGFVLAVAPFAVRYSQELRGYSMLVLLVTLGSWCFVRAIDSRRVGWFVAWAAVAGLACYAHLVALVVIGAQVASLVFLGRARIPWRHLAVAAVVGGLTLVPLASIVLSAADNQGVTDVVTLSSVRYVLVEVAGGRALLVVLGLLGLVPVWQAWSSLRARGPSPATWRPAFVVCGIVVPFLGVLVGALVAGRNWSERYVIVILPMVALAAGVAIRTIGDRHAVAAGAVLVVVAALSAVGVVRWYDAPAIDDWRTATATVLDRGTADDGIVFCVSPVRVPFEYYALRSPGRPRPTPLSPDDPWGDGVHLDEVDADVAAGWVDGPDRIWVVSRYASPDPFGACDLESSMAGRDQTFSRSFGAITVERYDR